MVKRGGSERSRIQSQDGQDLRIPAAATTHIVQTSAVTQSVPEYGSRLVSLLFIMNR